MYILDSNQVATVCFPNYEHFYMYKDVCIG